jgi:hypothetical protein
MAEPKILSLREEPTVTECDKRFQIAVEVDVDEACQLDFQFDLGSSSPCSLVTGEGLAKSIRRRRKQALGTETWSFRMTVRCPSGNSYTQRLKVTVVAVDGGQDADKLTLTVRC